MTTTYQCGKIYAIICNKTDKRYIGSTREKYLSRRLARHTYCYKAYLGNGKRYTTSFEIIKNDDYRIELLENFPCETKYELEKRERFYIETLDCVNKIIPTRTSKENPNTKIREKRDNSRRMKIKYHCDVCDKDYLLCHKKRHESRSFHINNLL